MPFGIPGGVIVMPGSPYNGQPVQSVLTQLNLQVQNGDPTARQQAMTDLQAIAALPQFHGFGWQGFVAMLSMMGAGAAAAALSGAGAAGAAGGAASGGAAGGTAAGGTAAGTTAAAGSGIGGTLLNAGLKAGVGVGASVLGNVLSKSGPSDLEQGVLSQDQATQRAAATAGQNVLSMGANAIQQPVDYWTKILSGDKSEITSAMAPEVSRIGQGYRTAAQTSSALSPRGGPSASFLSELPFAQQRDVSTLFQQARPAAATSLGTTGTNLIGQGSNLIYASTSAGRNILDQQRQQKLLEAERGKSIGAGLFDVLQRYGYPAIDKILTKKPATGGDMSQGAGY